MSRFRYGLFVSAAIRSASRTVMLSSRSPAHTATLAWQPGPPQEDIKPAAARTPPCASGKCVRIGPCAPAHDPASVVGHGDRKGREERMNTGTGAGSQAGKQKKARADAHRSPVRADSCLSGFWSMPCDLLLAAPSQRFVAFHCAPAAPWLPPDRPAGLPPTLPWGKNPARRGARGISGSGENFNRPGGRVQGTPQARAWASVRPSVRRFPPQSAPPK